VADVQVRRPEAGDLPAVASLIAAGFEAYVAPGYGEDGRAVFRAYVTAVAIVRRLAGGAVARVAVEDGPDGPGLVVGYGELRGRDHVPGGVDHLTLLFTAPGRLRQGIGRLLLDALVAAALERRPGLDSLTLNASSYAIPAYERLGFRATGAAASRNGMTSTPMRQGLESRASPDGPPPTPP
jgi:GNAT superfamily N-acetyltransferase